MLGHFFYVALSLRLRRGRRSLRCRQCSLYLETPVFEQRNPTFSLSCAAILCQTGERSFLETLVDGQKRLLTKLHIATDPTMDFALRQGASQFGRKLHHSFVRVRLQHQSHTLHHRAHAAERNRSVLATIRLGGTAVSVTHGFLQGKQLVFPWRKSPNGTIK